jgi:hypothetical protein
VLILIYASYSQFNQFNMDISKVSKDLYDIVNEKYIETPWTIIDSYFKDQHLERLVRHQIESNSKNNRNV